MHKTWGLVLALLPTVCLAAGSPASYDAELENAIDPAASAPANPPSNLPTANQTKKAAHQNSVNNPANAQSKSASPANGQSRNTTRPANAQNKTANGPANAQTKSASSNPGTGPTDAETTPLPAELLPNPMASAPGAAAPSAMPLMDLFSAEKNPGRGVMEYVHGTNTDKFSIGADSGHYVMGMVFAQDTLPETIQNDFKQNDVIQIAFGTLGRNTNGRVGQFGATTLRVTRGMQSQRLIPLRIPGSAEAPLPESGFLLFTSPEMTAQLSDEEKLKGTFFAKGGSITLLPISTVHTVPVQADGRKLTFKMQAMRMELLATLVTPFNNEEHQLKGRIEFPLYWPADANGKRLARRIAESSFNAKSSIHIPEDLTPTRRAVAAKPTQEPNLKPAPRKKPLKQP